jgi:hypothetical protein
MATDLRTAAQQALELLKQLQGGCTDSDDGTVEALTVWCPEVIENLEAALEQPEQGAHESWCASLTQLLLSHPPKPAPCNCNPPRREWRGLTKEENIALWLDHVVLVFGKHGINPILFARAIEAALKERNA